MSSANTDNDSVLCFNNSQDFKLAVSILIKGSPTGPVVYHLSMLAAVTSGQCFHMGLAHAK